MPEIRVADTRGVARQLATEVASAATGSIAARGRFAIAIPGGSVGTHCFPALAELRLDFNRVDVFWADERAVPPSDPESNYALAARLWLEPAQVPARSVHRMAADGRDLEAAAGAYASELSSLLGPEPVLDMALLGMGPDGHVASLFPGHAVLLEASRLVAAVSDAPKPPARRLTLTMPVLARARRVIVVAFGASKADALSQALVNEHSELPVAQLLRRAVSSLVLADEGAAAR